jgi:hypothetical protein
MRHSHTIATLATSLVLASCATTPANLHGRFTEVDAWHAANAQWRGSQVRWGGVVVGARATDAGDCLEVAQYPLDRFTLRPFFRFPGVPNATLTWSATASYPDAAARFLACGADSMGELHPLGSVLTMTGQLQPAQVFRVDAKQCQHAANARLVPTPDYSGTAHAAGDGLCVVALPTVAVTTVHTWDDRFWSPRVSSVR